MTWTFYLYLKVFGCMVVAMQKVNACTCFHFFFYLNYSNIMLHNYHLTWCRSEEGAETRWTIHIHRARCSKWYYAGISLVLSTMRIWAPVCSYYYSRCWNQDSTSSFHDIWLSLPCRWNTAQIISEGCWSFATVSCRWLPSYQGNRKKDFWGWIFGCKYQHGILVICLPRKSACIWSSF